jgi:cellobiose-specific phosphotransferase system component IIB
MSLLNTIKVIYHWTVLRLAQLANALVMSMVNTSFLKQKVTKYFTKRRIKISVGGKDEGKLDGTKYDVELVFLSPKVFRRIAAEGSIALSEGYMVRMLNNWCASSVVCLFCLETCD